MARIPGDPGPVGWLLFAIGFRLPARNRDWVKHELTDAGWRLRTVIRHLAVIVPICVILGVSLAVEQSLTVDQMAHTFAVYPSLSGSLTEAARRLMLPASGRH